MNVKELFLGGYAAISTDNEQDFYKLREWLSINNLFLPSGEPAIHLSFADGNNIAYKNDAGQIEYCGIEQRPDYIAHICSIGELLSSDHEITIQEEKEEAVPAKIEFKVTEIQPAVIHSNIKQFKEVIIPRVRQYKNIVVTKENFKEVKETLAMINASSKEINDYKIKVKKQANTTVIAFENDVKEILAAYNEVIEPIKNAIKKYEDEAREEKKKAYMNEITAVLNMVVSQNLLSQKYADKFEFDDNWLKSSYSRKKVLEEANGKINDLIALEKQDQQLRKTNIEAITQVLTQAMKTNAIEHGPDIQSYIDLYDEGMSVPFIIKQIHNDVGNLARAILKESEKKVEQAKQEVREEIEQKEMVQPASAPVSMVHDKNTVIDDKTGEVIGSYDKEKMTVKIQENKVPGKIFRYEYVFEGDAGVISTLSKMMKVLSKINHTFKYNGKRI